MSTLFKLMREQREKKPKTWQKIADFILENKTLVTGLKLKELSERIGVSEGSVVNFARSLGYEGYIELKVGIAQANGRFSDRYKNQESGNTVFESIAFSAKAALDETARMIDSAAVMSLARLLADTKGRVLVCGKLTSGHIAQILAGYLMRLGIPAFFGGDYPLAGTSLTKGDVLIAVTYSGKTEEILEAVRAARERGAYTVCITAFAAAEIAKLCDTCIAFTSVESKEGEFPIVARLVQLAVCDAICSAIHGIKEQGTK